jgi:hypothetical protein
MIVLIVLTVGPRVSFRSVNLLTSVCALWLLHPAASRPQRTVWIPQDEFGVSAREEKGCKEAGLRAASTNEYLRVVDRLKGKAKVGVQGGPPDLIGVVV